MIKGPVVLDTNVYLSGIIFGGNCRHILDLLIGKKIRTVVSPAILLEISQKLTQKFKWRREQVFTTVKAIIKITKTVRPQQKIKIEAAAAGGARYVVSGDQHLLKLKQYRKIRIVTPQEFLSIYFKKYG